MFDRGYEVEASLSMRALCKEPGERAPSLETLKDRQERLWSRASISIKVPNLEVGSSTGDFERWKKGTLGMEHLSTKMLRAEGL